MQAAVIVFPGSNCDRDVAVALKQASGRAPAMVWHKDSALPEGVDLIVLPGGFSYGDYLRCGAIAAKSPILRDVVARAKAGTRVLGICNGFQVLTEARLVPGALLENAGQRYICRDVHLRVDGADSDFARGYADGQAITIPIAHHDGNYFVSEDERKRLEDHAQIAFRYCDAKGQVTPEANPNGSVANIAGVFNKARTVLGMMPHPERLADPVLGGSEGRPLFDSLVEALS